MADTRKRVVLVTGASSGIGNSTATYLAKKGYKVYGTSRAPDSRPRRADEFFELVKMDTQNSDSVRKALDGILSAEGRLDALICNAGMGISGPVEETPIDDVIRQMDVNFVGTVRTIQAVLPSMRVAGGGTILVLSSIMGKVALPFQSFYTASKFALEGFMEGLRMETRRFGIRAALIEPGDFRTGFTASRRKAELAEGSPYGPWVNSALGIAEHDEQNGADPILIARLAHRLIQARSLKARYTVGPFAQRALIALRPFLPDALVEFGVMAMYGQLGKKPQP
ncbi:MAG: SDR family oxidoreductase [Spirochaetales bacterium]|nr:SDR family oxidoreductase [Spirochaetales bacterium]